MGAFKMCMSLEKLLLQEGVQKIGENVLLVTAVTKMYLPASVSELVRPWEWGKIALEVAPDNPNYFSDGYGLYEKHPEGYVLVAVRAEDERETYEVASGTVCIARHAFEGQMYIRNVVLSEGVNRLKKKLLRAARLYIRFLCRKVWLQIEADAFRCCINLEGIDLPASPADAW